jgi:hypothetical protein
VSTKQSLKPPNDFNLLRFGRAFAEATVSLASCRS